MAAIDLAARITDAGAVAVWTGVVANIVVAGNGVYRHGQAAMLLGGEGQIVRHVFAIQGDVARVEQHVWLRRVHMRDHGIPIGNEVRALAAEVGVRYLDKLEIGHVDLLGSLQFTVHA